MKRIISFFISLFIIIGTISCALCAFAEDMDNSNTEASINDIRHTESISFLCTFDPTTFSINLGGTVSHDILIQYRDYSLEIYAIPLGANVESVVFDPNSLAIAETAIAVKFQFSKKITSVIEKYYSYCVVLRSPEGKRILATDPKYAEVTASFAHDTIQRNSYKGIETEMVSSASNAGAGRVIIPVSLNRLISEASSGYVYQANNENIYFEKNYIESLDSKVRTVTSEGSEVYFRIFIDGIKSGITVLDYNGINFMPDVYDEKTLTRIEAAVAFLTDRYEDDQSGILNGIIIGRTVDDLSTDLIEAIDRAQYIDMYALYTIVVANSARQIRADMDIVIPFSDVNILNDPSGSMLETIISKFDHCLGSGLNCSVLIESNTSPLIIEDNKASFIFNDKKIQVHDLIIFDQYLEELSTKFESAPKSFIFSWKVTDDIHSNTLVAAYTYSYLKLIECKKMASFVISFADQESRNIYSGFTEVKHVFEHIDTAERDIVLNNVLELFSASTWNDILNSTYIETPVLRNIISAKVLDALPNGWIGEFTYFDFSKSVAFNNWFKGEYCKDIRLEYGNNGTSLKADMTPSSYGEYSEVLCLYDYPENLKYTPYIALKCKVQTELSEEALYEIMISGGQGSQRLTLSKTILSGKDAYIIFDISEYTQGFTDSLRISIRSLDGNKVDFSLLIYNIVGYSMEFDSQTLAEKIEEERLLIRNQSFVAENDTNRSTVIIIITITVLIISLGVGIFVCIRQSDDSTQQKNEKDKT